MCGIVGFVSKTKKIDLIYSLTQEMSHRGPDEINTAISKIGDSYLHLGSARLSITGLEDGDMPMKDERGNVLVYNGEIYELDKLRRKYHINLNSSSDTRHLLSLLSKEGISEINNLNGMYAFAYFDKNKEKIILGRDKLGIKPLYFGSNEKFEFYFSSEIKPLLLNNIINNKLSENSINNYLYLGGITAFEGFFSELNTQLPGSYTEYENKKVIKNIKFSKKSTNQKKIKYNQETFHKLFEEAMHDQLTAEVPVNILLSGGIDSSLIALYSKKYLKRDVTAYSLGYENKYYDESSKAADVSKKIDINLVEFNFPINKNTEIIEKLLNELPEPVADPSVIPNYYLAEKVSDYAKVVVSGDGADELFGGYEWYRGALYSRYIPSQISSLINQVLRLAKNNNEYISVKEKIKLFNLGNGLDFTSMMLLWQNYLPSENLNEQIHAYEEYNKNLGFCKKVDFENLRSLDIKNYLYSNILKKSDIAWMLNSIEVRPVFLDDRVFNFAHEVDYSSNFNFLNTKTFLKSILKSEIKDYSFTNKHGFSHDFGEWTHNVGLKYLEKEWSDLEEVSRLITYLKQNKENNYFASRYVWKFYSLFKWIQINKASI
tara:strand:+ start:79 stop:1884 length:1806 start_codon:yes stop_codon:yes gene_type:complete